MHNKLRREIADYIVHLKTEPNMDYSEVLLKRALDALGGPVEDNRPQEKTPVKKTPAVPLFFSTNVDPGDEDEAEYQSGLGAPLPQDEPTA